jgi:endonuclease/exonuclease/phosphatase family metal-dependent hydrolase
LKSRRWSDRRLSLAACVFATLIARASDDRGHEHEAFFELSQGDAAPHEGLGATVTVGGRDISVVATHLESSAKDTAARARETSLLLAALSGYAKTTPVILGGDLNATPDEGMFEAVRAAGFRPEESNDLSLGTRQKVVAGKVTVLGNHIDYVLVRGLAVVRDQTSPRVVPAAYPPGADGKMLGDHAIVTARVALPRP